MKPFHQIVNTPDNVFPVKMFIRSSEEEAYVYVHPHWHREMEILYVMEGGGVQQINGSIFDIGKGDIVIIGCDEVHSTYTDKGKDNLVLVLQYGMSSVMPESSLSAEESSTSGRGGFGLSHALNPDSDAGKEILKCIMEIKDEMDRTESAYQLFVKACLCKITGIISRNFSNPSINGKSSYRDVKARETLRNTFAYIDEAYKTDITLAQAAKASNVSVPHFCRIFREYAGMTFNEYLLLYRIRMAEKILATTASTITYAAYECGFNSTTSFNRAFMKYKKCTPSEYRKRL